MAATWQKYMFTVRAAWDGDSWVIAVGGVPEILSMVPRRDDVPREARRAIAHALGVREGSFDVVVNFTDRPKAAR